VLFPLSILGRVKRNIRTIVRYRFKVDCAKGEAFNVGFFSI
jgi:hypothetical protein